MKKQQKLQEKKVPEIRFPGFDGEWEEKRLGEVFNEISEKIGSDHFETYSITAGVGFVSQKKKFGRDISGAQNRRYTLLKPRQFSYNKGNSKTYKYGCVYLNELNKIIAVPNVYISFELNNPKNADQFFAKLFESHYLDRGLRKIISSSARMDGLLNVNKKNFFKLSIAFPTLPEQRKIASFLSSVDEWIEAMQNQKKALEQWKKGLMQKMFPADAKAGGKRIPEIRFPGFEGEWEEKRLGEVSECLDNKRVPLNKTQRNVINGDIPYYGANGVVDHINDYLFDEELILLAEDGGDFDNYNTRPIAQFITGKSWVNNHAHVLRIKSQNKIKFFFYTLVHKDIRKYIVGGSRAKLNKSDMLSIKLYVPSVIEQQKIASFLTTVDNIIELKSERIKLAEEWKRGLMQKMFV